MKRFFLLGEFFLLFSGVIMASGLVLTGESETGGVIGSGTAATTGVVEVVEGEVEFLPYDLIITEVYGDGHDERIEIFNQGEGVFSGEVLLEGVKSDPLVVQGLYIRAGEAVIIADKVDAFLQTDQVALSGAGLNFPDTQKIDITLTIDGQSEDVFQIDEATVNLYNDQKRSFYKGQYEGQRFQAVSLGGQAINIIEGISAHPGITVPIQDSKNIIVEEIIVCPTASGNIQLSEIFLGNETLSTYLEIYFAQPFSGRLLLTGSSLVSPFFLDIDQKIDAGDYLIITQSDSGLHHDQIVQKVDNLGLASGEIQINGQTGQVLDKVVVELRENTSSYYVSRDGNDCRGQTNPHHQHTPGFSQSFLDYIDIAPITITGSSCDEESHGGDDREVTVIDVSLRGITAAPLSGDESLVLRLDRGPQELDLAGYYILKGSTKRYLHGVLSKGNEKELYQNYGFSNTRGGCVTLHEPNGGQLDDICYTKEQVGGYNKWQEREESASATGSNTLLPEIEIVAVEYDPPGSDVGAEKITLNNLNERQYVAKDLWLQVGDRSSKTYIAEALSGEGHYEYVANFRFPNQDTCVLLMYQEKVLDTYCYNVHSAETSKSGTSLSATHPRVKVEIIAVDYDPNGSDTNRESITLRYVEGDESSLKLDGFRLLVGKQKKTLPIELVLGEDAMLTKTFGFPNTRVTCLTLMHGDKAYDVFCYNPNEREEREAATANTERGKLKIIDIEYDPEGNDRGRESISFTYLATGSVSLSGYDLEINGRKKSLGTDEIVHHHGTLTLTGTFGFLNAGACVSLVYATDEIDKVCYGDALDDLMLQREEPELLGDLVVLDVLYDPPGKDTNNESISLLYSGVNTIDLSKITMLVNNQKRSLSGILIPGVRTTFQSNYRFPNSPTCIQLQYKEHTITTYCYGQLALNHEAPIVASAKTGDRMQIVSMAYDPPGSDVNNELVTISLPLNVSHEQLTLVNKGKSYTLTNGRKNIQGYYVFQGTFNLPNRLGCVELHYQKLLVDRYCYHDRNEVDADNERLEDLSNEILALLNVISLQQESQEDCVSYKGRTITCKSKKTTKAFASQDKFYTSYIQSMHDYLYYSWPMLYYHTDMRQYMTTYRSALKQIRDEQETITIGTREYQTADFSLIMADQYRDSYYEWFVYGVEQLFSTGDVLLLSQ